MDGFAQSPRASCAQETLPASQYLQERLQERRARNMRPMKRKTDLGPMRSSGRDDDIFLEHAEESRPEASRLYDSSPIPASNGRRVTHGSRRPSLGVRDLDTQLDRLQKQNFALKLELDHRRDHTAKLQERIESMHLQVERAETLSREHAELLQINSDLVAELEKRDKAVEEAIDIISDLEERVSDLEERRTAQTRPSTAQADSGYAGTETHEVLPPSSPPEVVRQTPRVESRASAANASQRLQGVVGRPAQTPARTRREPSFLSQKKASTRALRSVYLESAQALHPVQSFNSLLSKRDSRVDEQDGVLDSPRLSVLSESSFPSLYSPKKENGSPEKYAWEGEDEGASGQGHLRQDSIKRVSLWMEDHEGVGSPTPSRRGRVGSPLTAQLEHEVAATGVPCAEEEEEEEEEEELFQSLNHAMSPTPGQKGADIIQPLTYQPSRGNKSAGKLPRNNRGPLFGHPSPMLPPTPDSASTRLLRASHSSIAVTDDNPSILDNSTPQPMKSYRPLDPQSAPSLGARTAPKQFRSSIELNSAYRQHRVRAGDSSSSDTASEYEGDDGTVKDLSLDYDGFPDGNSIIMGTPSRFLKHGRPAPALFDPKQVSPTEEVHAPPQPMRRRQSSGDITSPQTRKPSLGRAETSPGFLSTLGRMVSGGSGSTHTSDANLSIITSPSRSSHSNGSSSRTIIASPTTTSLEPTSSRTTTSSSISPARSAATTLGQKTQQLFRRMSNSRPAAEPRSPSRADRERALSPLPTLTRAPSSAYVDVVPRQVRRPSSSAAEAGRRPSLAGQMGRSRTEGRVSAAGEKGTGKGMGKEEKESGVVRGGLTRRRGSIREAVGARRPWR